MNYLCEKREIVNSNEVEYNKQSPDLSARVTFQNIDDYCRSSKQKMPERVFLSEIFSRTKYISKQNTI